LLATLDAPHILILDEPTNHLDIQSREALVTALNDYRGAIILVSHDPHLVSLTADRLWLVKDGKVTVFREDMDAYRKLLLAERGGTKTAAPAEKKARPAKVKPKITRKSAPLKAEISKCEQRVSKLEAMQTTLDRRLGDPSLYEAASAPKLAALQKKHLELQEALARAEAMWLTAVEKLDQAQGV
jgi:ATP-binding cassette subfamily F protein 3